MAQSQSTRALALARRKALSTGGKGAMTGSSAERTRGESAAATSPAPAPTAAPAPTRARARVPSSPSSNSTRDLALARRKALSSHGKRADTSTDRTTTGGAKTRKAAAMAAAPETKKSDCGCGCEGRRADEAPSAPPRSRGPRSARPNGGPRRSVQANPTRAAALARRQAQSTRGKAGIGNGSVTPAQTARAANPGLSTRDLARELRSMRSRNGKTGASTQKRGDCSGRRRQRPKESEQGAAQDQAWKVGVSETSHGQPVTGTMVGRSASVTGDEASTCRSVTGTEYLGADMFREFCQTEPSKTPLRVGVSATGRNNVVTGNEVGRSENVTGDEPGTCKRVTGSDYVSPGQTQAFCNATPEPGPAKVSRVETAKGKSVTGSNVGRSAKVTGDEVGANRATTGTQYTKPSDIGNAPRKVGVSDTLRGGSVTGTRVGRRRQMTGDEPGSCRNVTGDDYVGREQFNDFCGATPAPQDRKVGVSRTAGGEGVTGTMTGRSSRVTGDEPGTCKAVTGTPYAGLEQSADFCEAAQQRETQQRTQPSARSAGMSLTGQQPGVGGKMTGAGKGACEAISGTPYVGSDQLAEACAASPAQPGSPDFPQAMGGTPWGDFTVEPPAHASDGQRQTSAVTGSRYEQGHITGPFGMATGKVTGTEEKRFGTADDTPPVPETRPEIEGRVASRITGEGQDAGVFVTGDDWDRGDHVTGTEGSSAARRNPTRRGGPMNAMSFRKLEPRNDDLPDPVSKVTGSSGNTDVGSLVTYSGGARG